MKTTKFQLIPGKVLGGVHDTVPYELGPHYRRNYVFELESNIRLPAFTVETRGEDVRIAGPSFGDTIPADTERTYELDPRDVTVELLKTTDERHNNPDVPGRLLGLKRQAWTEIVTLTPILKVRNFGELQVVDARDNIVVRQ